MAIARARLRMIESHLIREAPAAGALLGADRVGEEHRAVLGDQPHDEAPGLDRDLAEVGDAAPREERAWVERLVERPRAAHRRRERAGGEPAGGTLRPRRRS